MATFHLAARLAARAELRKRGVGFFKVRDLIDAATDDVVDSAVEKSGVSLPAAAFGDGSIIDAIFEFFKSEQGKKIIDALIAILLAFL